MTTGRDQRLFVAAQNLVKFNELEKVLRVFQDHGIPVIVLKGAALANSVYDSIGERPMCDVDLLILKQDRLRILSILETAGYQIESLPPKKFHPFSNNLMGEISFNSKSGGKFDLHWELTNAEWVRKIIRLDMDTLWRSSQPLEINRVKTLQLSTVDTLLHICLHLMVSAYTHRVAERDIVALVNHHQPFPWQAFLERATDFHVKTACYFAIEAMAVNYRAVIPPDVIEALNPPSRIKWLIHRIADPIKSMQGQVTLRNRRFLVHIVTADRLWDVVKMLFWLFFPGTKWLEERYILRNRMEVWLACLWHPLVVLRGCLLRVWEVLKGG